MNAIVPTSALIEINSRCVASDVTLRIDINYWLYNVYIGIIGNVCMYIQIKNSHLWSWIPKPTSSYMNVYDPGVPSIRFPKNTGSRMVNLCVAFFKFLWELSHALIILNSGNFMQKRNKRAMTSVFACCFILHST